MRDNLRELDYDLMTRTGRSYAEWTSTGAAGVVSVARFVQCLDADSRVVAANSGYKEWALWSSDHKRAQMLADLYDLIAAFQYTVLQQRSKRKLKKPKPYPRPWVDTGSKKFGSKPIKVSKFWDWWNSKSKSKQKG